jgi:hypothetical protein
MCTLMQLTASVWFLTGIGWNDRPKKWPIFNVWYSIGSHRWLLLSRGLGEPDNTKERDAECAPSTPAQVHRTA